MLFVVAFAACLAALSPYEITQIRHPTLHNATALRLSIVDISVESGNFSVASVTAKCQSSGDIFTIHGHRLPKHVHESASVDLFTLKPASIYSVAVSMVQHDSSQDRTHEIKLNVHTESAVATMPYINVDSYDPTIYAPGWTFWSGFPAPPGANTTYWAGSMFIDEKGTPRWGVDCYTLFGTYFPSLLTDKCGLTGMQTKLKNGNMLMLWSINDAMVFKVGLTGMVEVSPSGTLVHIWAAVKVGKITWTNHVIHHSKHHRSYCHH